MMTGLHTAPNARDIKRGIIIVAGIDISALKERSRKKKFSGKNFSFFSYSKNW
jgi:hypothetical protein